MESFARLRPMVKVLLVSLVILHTLLGPRHIAKSFSHPQIYKKDFLSGYLLAKALQSGVDPYLPLPELAGRFMPENNHTGIKHPTPHPIAMGWLCYPFAWLPYETAVWLWFGCELILLALAIKLLFDGLGWKLSWQRWLLAFWFALGWMPIVEDLWFGQFSIMLLVLWLCSWRALQQSRDGLSGVAIGVMMTLKLAGWPLILWLACQRRWRAVFAAALTAGSLHLTAIALHGWPMTRDYYFKYGPMVSAVYRIADFNHSLMTFGWRAFAPFGGNYIIAPLWNSPALAKLISIALPLIGLALALYAAQCIKRFDAAFALIMTASMLLNPISWTHYLMGSCLALALLAERLQELQWPRRYTRQLLFCVLTISLPTSTWTILVLLFTGNISNLQRPVVPFWAPWLSAFPTYGVVGLAWLLWHLEQRQESAATAPATIRLGELTPSHG